MKAWGLWRKFGIADVPIGRESQMRKPREASITGAEFRLDTMNVQVTPLVMGFLVIPRILD